MLNFTQRLYFKIIALTVAVTLFTESTVYGMNVPTRKHLRVPMSFVSPDGKTFPELSEDYVRENNLSFVMIKPDGIAQKDTIVQMLKDAGIKIVYESKAMRLSREQTEGFYVEHKGKPFYEVLLGYITSGEVIPILIRSQDEDAIADVRRIVGPTKGEDDTGTVDIGTIRGRLMTDDDRSSQPIRNRIHASDSVESAVREANIVMVGSRPCIKAEVKLWVEHPAGLHGRPSGEIVKAVREGNSEVMLHCEESIVDASNEGDILALGISYDHEIELVAVGPDAREVLEKICEISDEEKRYFYVEGALSLIDVSDSMVDKMASIFKDKNKPIEQRVEALVFLTKITSDKKFLLEVLDDTGEEAKVLEYAIRLLSSLAQKSHQDIPKLIERLGKLRKEIRSYKKVVNTHDELDLLGIIYTEIEKLSNINTDDLLEPERKASSFL